MLADEIAEQPPVVHRLHEVVHRLAPGPEAAGASRKVVAAAAQSALEGVRMDIDESGQERHARHRFARRSSGHRAQFGDATGGIDTDAQEGFEDAVEIDQLGREPALLHRRAPQKAIHHHGQELGAAPELLLGQPFVRPVGGFDRPRTPDDAFEAQGGERSAVGRERRAARLRLPGESAQLAVER